MEFAFKHRAADIFSQAVADVLMPAEELTPSQWAEAHLTVPDGPLAGQKFSLALTEYLREPLATARAPLLRCWSCPERRLARPPRKLASRSSI
jgi:hypothetical protein